MYYNKENYDYEYKISKELYDGNIDIFKEDIENKKIFNKTKYVKNLIKPAIDRRTSLMLYTTNNNKDFILDFEENHKDLEEKIYDKLFKNNFGELLSQLCKETNIYGNMLLKVYKKEDDTDIKIKIQNFNSVKKIDKDSRGKIVYLELEYKEYKSDDKVDEYIEIYTPEKIVIKKNDEENVYDSYGFVPFIHFKNTEDFYGTPISMETAELMKRLNELDSIARINIKTLVERLIFASVKDKTSQDNLKLSIYKSKDSSNKIWFGDEDTKLQELKPTDIPATFLSYMDRLEQHIFRVLPEYSLDILRENANASGEALNTQLKVLEQKINNLQKIFLNSLNRFIECLLIIMQKEGEIPTNISIEKMQYNCKFNNFFKSFEEREQLAEDKKDLEKRIEYRYKLISAIVDQHSKGLFEQEYVENKIIKYEEEIKELEEKIDIIKEKISLN